MKAILKACSLLAMVAIMGSSCSVERKTRDGKKNVIDVGMNLKEYKHNMASASTTQGSTVAMATR